jgi:hypothetical protein
MVVWKLWTHLQPWCCDYRQAPLASSSYETDIFRFMRCVGEICGVELALIKAKSFCLSMVLRHDLISITWDTGSFILLSTVYVPQILL